MKHFIFIIFLLMAFHLNAQVDGQKSVPIPAVETKEDKKEPLPQPIDIKPENKPSLTNKKDNFSGIPVQNRVTMKPSEKEFSMVEDNNLIDPGVIYDEKWADEKRKKQLEIYENIPPELLGDQFLGDFKIKGEYVTVICRDHGLEDGDFIQVMVNDEIFISKLILTSQFKKIKIPLTAGINKIDFHALNQGEVGLNTAEFQIYDENDRLIFNKSWYLVTEKEATLIMVKE